MGNNSHVILVGGTFDPPHKRHAKLIGALARIDWVDELVIMPVIQNPQKSWAPMFSFAQRVTMMFETLKWFEPGLTQSNVLKITEVAKQLSSPSHISEAIDFYLRTEPRWKLWLYLPGEARNWIDLAAIASRCPRGVFMNDGSENILGVVEELMKIGFSSLALINFRDITAKINSMKIRQEIKAGNLDFLDKAPICPFVRNIAKELIVAGGTRAF